VTWKEASPNTRPCFATIGKVVLPEIIYNFLNVYTFKVKLGK